MRYLKQLVKYLIFTLIFIIRFYFAIPDCNNDKNICYYKNHGSIDINGIIDTEVAFEFNKKVFDVKIFEINNKKQNGIIKVNYYGKENLKFHDKISFSCEIQKLEGGYKRYLENKNIYILCNSKDVDFVNIKENLLLQVKYKLFEFSYEIKKIIVERIKKVYSDKYSGFLISFLIGDKNYISKRIENLMLSAGISHITSISGFNINLIIAFLYFVFTNIGINRKRVFYIIIPILIIFGIITGLNPPILRAIIMSLSILFIQNIGRTYNSLNILFFTGYIMLFFNPKNLFDISFLLSFFSCFAIIFLKPKIDKLIPIKKDFLSLKDNLFCTISVFVITSPIVYLFFSKLNFLSIINNILILPFVTYLYFFGFMSLLISPISFVTCFVLDYVYWVIGG